MLPGLSGIPGFTGKRDNLTATFRGATLNNADRATYDFTGEAIGTASLDRYIALVAVGRQTSSITVTSATIDSVAMTRAVHIAGNVHGAIFLSATPITSGTTADFSVVLSGVSSRFAIFVYTITGSDVVSVRDSLTAAGSINVDNGGCIVAGTYDLGGASITWTNLTEAGVELSLEGPNSSVSAYHNSSATESRAISATSTDLFIAASFTR